MPPPLPERTPACGHRPTVLPATLLLALLAPTAPAQRDAETLAPFASFRDTLILGLRSERRGEIELLRLRGVHVRTREPGSTATQERWVPLSLRGQDAQMLELASEADDEHAFVLTVRHDTATGGFLVRLVDELGMRQRIDALELRYDWVRGPLPERENHRLADEEDPSAAVHCHGDGYAAVLLARRSPVRRLPRYVASEGGARPGLAQGQSGVAEPLQDESLVLEHELHFWRVEDGLELQKRILARRHARDAADAAWQLDQEVAPVRAALRARLEAASNAAPFDERSFGPGELAALLWRLRAERAPPAVQDAALALAVAAPRRGALFATRRGRGPQGWQWSRDPDGLHDLAEICGVAEAMLALAGKRDSTAAREARERGAELLRFLQANVRAGGLWPRYDEVLLPRRDRPEGRRWSWCAAAELALAIGGEAGHDVAFRCLLALRADPVPTAQWSSRELVAAAGLALALESAEDTGWLLASALRQRLASLPFTSRPAIGSLRGTSPADELEATSRAPELFAAAWRQSSDAAWLERSVLALRAPLPASTTGERAARGLVLLDERGDAMRRAMREQVGRAFEFDARRVHFAPTREHLRGQRLLFRVRAEGGAFDAFVHVRRAEAVWELPLAPAGSPGLYTVELPARLIAEGDAALHCYLNWREGDTWRRLPREGAFEIRLTPDLLADTGDDDERQLLDAGASEIRIAADGRERARWLPPGSELLYAFELPPEVTVAELQARHEGALLLQLGDAARPSELRQRGELGSSRWRVAVRRDEPKEPWRVRLRAGERGASLASLRVRILQNGSEVPVVGAHVPPTRTLPAQLVLRLVPLGLRSVPTLGRERLRLQLFGGVGRSTWTADGSFAYWLDRTSHARIDVSGDVLPWHVAPAAPELDAGVGAWRAFAGELPQIPSDGVAVTAFLLAGVRGEARVLRAGEAHWLWLLPSEAPAEELVPALQRAFLTTFAPMPGAAPGLHALEGDLGTPLMQRLASVGLASCIRLRPTQHFSLSLPLMGPGSFGLRLELPGGPERAHFDLENRPPSSIPGWEQGGALLTVQWPEANVAWAPPAPISDLRLLPARELAWQRPEAGLPQPLRRGRLELVTEYGERAWELHLRETGEGAVRLDALCLADSVCGSDLTWTWRQNAEDAWILRPGLPKDPSWEFGWAVPGTVRMLSNSVLPRGGARLTLRARRSAAGGDLLFSVFVLDARGRRTIAEGSWPASEERLDLEVWLPAGHGEAQRYGCDWHAANTDTQVEVDELWVVPLLPPVLDLLALAPPQRHSSDVSTPNADGWRRGPALRLGGVEQDRFEIPISIPRGGVLARVAVAATSAGPLPEWSLEFLPSRGGAGQRLVPWQRARRGAPQLQILDLSGLGGTTGFLVFRSRGAGASLELLTPSLRRR